MSSGNRYTHIDTACGLLEFRGWRFVTDPVFDAPGRRYWFGWGTSSRKTSTPALQPEQLPAIDVVLLSHDQHQDNLDEAGRQWIAGAPRILTTQAAARRLKHAYVSASGLPPGTRTLLESADRPTLEVIAVPAQHRPSWLPEFISGPAIGFLIRAVDDPADSIYITGDTVVTQKQLAAVAKHRPRVLICHVGAVAFPYLLGNARFTMTASQSAQLAAASGCDAVVVVHTEGWTHFRQGHAQVREAYRDAGLTHLLRDYQSGTAIEL